MTTIPGDPAALQQLIADLRRSAASASSDEEARAITAQIAGITRSFRARYGIGIPATMLDQAVELEPKFRVLPHLKYISDRVAAAVRDVEAGQNRMLEINLPPRAGKSTLLNKYGPIQLLRKHPDWKIISTSYDAGLTYGWARDIRQMIESKPQLGIELAPDGGAGGEWSTVQGGGMYATSVRGSLTGRGAKVFLIDDPIKDFAEAHSALARQTLWDWWLSVANTRLETPYLVLVILTRWHEDDFAGRIFSPEYEGDPELWERISIPAIAEENDLLGRRPGDPLLSPLAEETRQQALDRWDDTRRAVGSYTFASMFQQRPSPARGAIFDASWWRFWTINADRATEDGRVVYLDPSSLTSGLWLDSWDASFDKSDSGAGSWVVGQRWVRHQANRYLIAQQRKKWSFTETLDGMRRWAGPSLPIVNPQGHLVHKRLVEKKANGAAIIDVLKDQIGGIKPITPHESKEARARAVTPEVEAGNVFLPYPSDPGNEWVYDYLTEMRDFPNGFSDDQVDSTTQALAELRGGGTGKITVPGAASRSRQSSVAEAARSMGRRSVLPGIRR